MSKDKKQKKHDAITAKISTAVHNLDWWVSLAKELSWEYPRFRLPWSEKKALDFLKNYLSGIDGIEKDKIPGIHFLRAIGKIEHLSDQDKLWLDFMQYN